MATVIERRSYSAFGGNSGTLKTKVPGLGLTGITNRWIGSMLPSSGAVSEWIPYLGSVKLVQASSAAQPIVGTVSGQKVLRTDGVDDTISSLSLTPAKSTLMLVRVLDAPGTTKGFAAFDGGYVSRGSTGGVSTVRVGTSNLNQTGISVDQPLFHLVAIIQDFAAGYSGTYVDGVWNTQPTDRENTNIVLGRGASTVFSNTEYKDLAISSVKAYTKAELDVARAALQATYPGQVA